MMQGEEAERGWAELRRMTPVCVCGHGVSMGKVAGIKECPGALWFLLMKKRTRNRMTFHTGRNKCEVTEAALTSINPLLWELSLAGLPEPG